LVSNANLTIEWVSVSVSDFDLGIGIGIGIGCFQPILLRILAFLGFLP
jgi:hypothetical protein